jgi:uncharacterized repeat protein (TIGR02543 family)
MNLVKKILPILTALAVVCPLFAQKTVQRTITGNLIQNINGWDVETWADSRGGQVLNMDLYTDGTFDGRWTNSYNTLIRTGKKFASNQTIAGLGSAPDQITLRYDVSNFSSTNGATYMCVYGWTRNQMTEWYVVDDWKHWHPPTNGSGGYQNLGTLTVDGGTYDIIVATRDQQPSIDGTRTFLQIFSIRRTTRTSGTINITAHFNRWAEVVRNISIGSERISFSNSANLYEVSFCIEGFGGNNGSSGRGTVNELCIKWGSGNSNRLCSNGGCPNCTGTTPGHHVLTTNVTPAGAGTITRNPNASSYAPGTQVTLTRPTSTDWVFSGWSGGGCSGTGTTCTVTMNQAITVTATYTPSPDANLVRDGNFPGTSLPSTWSLNTGEYYGNSAATSSVSSGRVTINITTVGAEAYQPQLAQQGISLTQGRNYRLTFDASAVSARTIGAILQQSSGDYTAYASQDFNLTTTQQSFTLNFTMTAASDPSAQLAFNLGQSNANVTISNVRLNDVTGTTSVRTVNTARHNISSLITVKAKSIIVNESPETKVQIRVVNLTGRTIASFNTRGGSTLSLKKIPAGMYIIEAKRMNDGMRVTSNVVLS